MGQILVGADLQPKYLAEHLLWFWLGNVPKIG